MSRWTTFCWRTGKAGPTASRATDPLCGADYRMGFLDGRLEVFRLHAAVRKIVEDT